MTSKETGTTTLVTPQNTLIHSGIPKPTQQPRPELYRTPSSVEFDILRSQLADREKEVNFLCTQLSERDVKVSSLQSSLNQRRGEVIELRSRVRDHLRDKTADMKALKEARELAKETGKELRVLRATDEEKSKDLQVKTEELDNMEKRFVKERNKVMHLKESVRTYKKVLPDTLKVLERRTKWFSKVTSITHLLLPPLMGPTESRRDRELCEVRRVP